MDDSHKVKTRIVNLETNRPPHEVVPSRTDSLAAPLLPLPELRRERCSRRFRGSDLLPWENKHVPRFLFETNASQRIQLTAAPQASPLRNPAALRKKNQPPHPRTCSSPAAASDRMPIAFPPQRRTAFLGTVTQRGFVDPLTSSVTFKQRALMG